MITPYIHQPTPAFNTAHVNEWFTQGSVARHVERPVAPRKTVDRDYLKESPLRRNDFCGYSVTTHLMIF